LAKKIAVSLVATLVAATVGVLYFFSPLKAREVIPGRAVIVRVENGMAASQIARLLEDKGVIADARRFMLESSLRGLDNSLQAGEYELVTGLSNADILDKIASGAVRRITVTIPEGFGVKDIAARLAEAGLADKEAFLLAAKDYTPYSYMRTDDELVEYKSEGFLFPSTYHIEPGASAKDLLALLAGEFDRQLTGEMRRTLAEKNISVRDFVTLASLVEKEAAAAEDRRFIAKVFLRRLFIGMPLQSCATIQYILGYPKAELTVADTKLPSPYNTYLYYGLPPGPIASPGLSSLQAVLAPAAENYLYFVAQKNGKHLFSYTYDEHLAAIRKAAQ
jgi:UPF0755 protein